MYLEKRGTDGAEQALSVPAQAPYKVTYLALRSTLRGYLTNQLLMVYRHHSCR